MRLHMLLEKLGIAEFGIMLGAAVWGISVDTLPDRFAIEYAA